MLLFSGILVIIVLVIAYMYYKAFADKITYETITHAKIPQAFNDYKIFFITDVHRRKIKLTTLQSITEKIDIVLIGGDIVERGVPLERMRENIIMLKRWNVPIYFVWGNNDYKSDYFSIRQILFEESIIILEDDTVRINQKNSFIKLVGFNYYADPDIVPKINWEESAEDFTLLLTHTPNSFFLLPEASKQKIDFVFAGHTHGGQIRFYQFGLDIKGGYYQDKQTQMFISEGYGSRLIPFRFQTQAECHIISLQSR